METVKKQISTIKSDLRVRKSLVEKPARIKYPVRAIELQLLIQQQQQKNTSKTFARSRSEKLVMSFHFLSGKTELETY